MENLEKFIKKTLPKFPEFVGRPLRQYLVEPLRKGVVNFLNPYIKNIKPYIEKIADFVKLYIGKVIDFVSPHVKRGIAYFKANKTARIVTGIAVLILIISIPLSIWWFTTPRAPRLKTSKNSEYLYQAENQIYKAFIGNRENNTPTVQYSVNGSQVTFTPASGDPTLDSPTKEGKALTFKNVYPNIDYKYEVITNGIKEDIIINEPSVVKNFPFYVDFEGVTPKYFAENLAGGVFYDENGKYVFHFEEPYAVDANGEKTEDIQLLLKREKSSGRYIANIGINPDWAYADERSYPIRIDPTIVHDTSSEFSSGQLNRVKDTGSGSSPNLETYYQELPADEHTVALWHMDEGSDNTCSGGEDICDASGNGHHGTFTNTAAFNGTGKIGDDSITLDGDSDYADVSNSTDFDIQQLTIEAWARSNNWSSSQFIFEKGPVNTQYSCFFTGGSIIFRTDNSSATQDDLTVSVSDTSLVDGEWGHVACVYNGNSKLIYVDGKLIGSKAYTQTLQTGQSGQRIGAHGSGGYYFNGEIDELRISSIGRSPEEIKAAAERRSYSAFTSNSIDLLGVSALNSLSWTESGVTTGDGETVADSSNLVAQWDFNETSGTSANNDAEGSSCGGTPANCDGTLNGFSNTSGQDVVAGSGWTSDNKRWGGGAIMVDGSDDYVNIPDNANLEPANTLTVETWVKPNTSNQPTSATIVSKRYDASTAPYNSYIIDASGTDPYKFCVSTGGSQSCVESPLDKEPEWTHIVGTYDGSNIKIYINGKEENSASKTGNIDYSTLSLRIGCALLGSACFDGNIDSLKIYSRTHSASEILANYNSGQIEFQTRTSSDNSTWEEWKPTTNETQILSLDSDSSNWSWDNTATNAPISKSDTSNIEIEGAGSMKLEVGKLQSDANTVGLFDLNETNGDVSGTDINDSSGNSNNLEINGTNLGSNVVNGIEGKARNFNGSDDYLCSDANADGTCDDDTDFDITSSMTIEAWIKSDSETNPSALEIITAKALFGSGSNTDDAHDFRINTSGQLHFKVNDGGTAYEVTGTTDIYDGNWHHVAGVFNAGNTVKVYVDGEEENSIGGPTSINNVSPSFTVGAVEHGSSGTSNHFDGSIDEVRVSSTARSAEEIAEAFRAGSNHRINRTITSTNLSSANKLPFYVAADRPGTYLESTIGESGFDNNTSDANTVGLWHLEEEVGSGAYIKDSSGNGNNGTPTGTSIIKGKIGKARDFNGTGDLIDVNSVPDSVFQSNFTVQAWVNFAAVNRSEDNAILGHGSASSNQGLHLIERNGKAYFGFYGNDISGNTNLSADTWYHIAFVYDGGKKIYVNGQLDSSGTSNQYTGTGSNAEIGRLPWAGTNNYSGIIDEISISDSARSAQEIRQVYEAGIRKHEITIDFAADLDSGNLISGSGDTSFTVDATAYGLSEKGSMLFEGDKVIVKENVSGTEYIAQGDVSSITTSTGATTVDAWDSGSTFPSSGFTADATVFKWQREFWDITEPLDSQINAVTDLTLRITDGSQGRTIWLDDINSNTDYMTNNAGSTINSTAQRYFQYKAVFSSTDTDISPSLTSVTVDYTDNESPNAPTLNNEYEHDKLRTSDTTPEVRFSGTDPESDDLSYQIQWDTDASFPSPTSAVSDTDPGFSNITTPADTDPFNSGDTVSYTFQSALSDSTTYYYRVRSKDPGGSNTYGAYSSIKSLTIDNTQGGVDGWYETQADQFNSDTLTGAASINTGGDYISVGVDTEIDDADTASNWVSSDSTNLTVSQEATIVQEGTGSVQLDAVSYLGDGSDGSITVSSNTDINSTNLISGRGCADGGDAVNYSITSLSSTSATLSSTPSSGCLSAGDEILLINLQGTSSSQTNVGNYETLRIDSVSSNTVNFTTDKSNFYGDGASNDTNIGTSSSNQRVMLQRVPNYTDVTVNSSINFNPTAWNGTKGGVMFFRATGTVSVSGTITAAEDGYRGASIAGGTSGGRRGESTSGHPNNVTTSSTPEGGGGGGERNPSGGQSGGGGGGGYATSGSNGTAGDGSAGGSGGGTYGDSSLDTLHLGSGGGSGGQGTALTSRPGERGGGIIMIAGNSISVSGGINSDGANGTGPNSVSGGGGAGSGGSIKIIGDSLSLGSSLVTASGGSGHGAGGGGGAGGDGRIAVSSRDSTSGTTSPTYSSANIDDSLNDTATLTTSATDISGASSITFWVRSDRTGSFMQFEFGESSSGEQTHSFTINSANTWEQKTWDITGITGTDRDAVTKFAFKVTNADEETTFYFDDIQSTAPGNGTGTVTSTAITAANLNSSISTWGTLVFTDDETNGDIKYKIYYDDNGSPTLVPDGTLSGNSTGFDSSPVNLGGLSTTTYPILYAGAELTYSGGTPELQDWAVNLNSTPTVPTLNSPTGGTSVGKTPSLSLTSTDIDGDDIQYKIEVCEDSGMTQNCQTFDQTQSQTGWSGQNSGSGTRYTSGTTASYTFQSEISGDQTYYWRGYAIDPLGTNSFGSVSTTESFNVGTQWLDGYDKRIEITVDNSNIDSNLTHFPIPIFIGSSVGQDNEDTTAIFDEVGANWQKLAVTEGDGYTQLYVEKEKWDSSNKEGLIWVSRSDFTLSSSGQTTMYIYYDNDQSDNTTYVADTGSRTEVWDSNYKAIWHLNQDPGPGGAGDIIDSTSNNNDGTAEATMTSGDLVSGKIGYGIEFDGADDYISISSTSSLDISSQNKYTLEAQTYHTGGSSEEVGILTEQYNGSGEPITFALGLDQSASADGGTSRPMTGFYDGSWHNAISSSSITDNSWQQLVGTWDGTTMKVYENNTETASTTPGSSLPSDNDTVYIGRRHDTTGTAFFTGTLDEIRISDTNRSVSWNKADYYAQNDDFLSFGNEQVPNNWLTGWDNRIKISIDSTNIDTDLTHFPLPIIINNSAGKASQDLTQVFDEIGANWQKLAITEEDGTQLYVEKEKWDSGNEQGVLWVSKSDFVVSSDENTILYLYYDNDQSNNTTYVADVGSRTEVWDSNYAGVWHLGETSGTFVDSTSNNNDSSGERITSYSVTGKVGDAINVVEGDDGVRINDNNSLDLTGDITVQTWGNTDKQLSTYTNNFPQILAKSNATYRLGVYTSGSDNMGIRVDPSFVAETEYTYTGSNEWKYWTGRYTNSTTTAKIYENGTLKNTNSGTGYNNTDTDGNNVLIGAGWEGEVDESRLSNTDRSDAWVKADYYAMDDNLLLYETDEGGDTETAVGWLSGWQNRIKITADYSNIDENLTHFPIPIFLGTSVGRDGDDTSAVFDELGSSSKKIAITKEDGTTQIYGEIESWNSGSETALIWTSSSSLTLNSDTLTHLYLYYDSSQADNTTYIGDPGNRGEVWDSNYQAVYHLSDDDSDTTVIDSTSNNHDGAKTTSSGPSQTTGQLGSAQHFDASDDYISDSDTYLNGISSMSYSMWVNSDTTGHDRPIFTTRSASYGIANDDFTGIRFDTSGFSGSGTEVLKPAVYIDGSASTGESVSNETSTDWMYLGLTWNSGNAPILYKNGDTLGWSFAPTSISGTNDSDVLAVGRGNKDEWWDGIIDEFRASSTERSASWVKANYYAQEDDILTFSNTETGGGSDTLKIEGLDFDGINFN